MFKSSTVEVFMGGEFKLDHPGKWTALILAEEFRNWAKEVDSWDDEEIAEVAIVKGRICVTLKEGIHR